MSVKRKLRFGLVGLSSDHVWGMGDGLAKQPEVEMVAAAEGYTELREKAVQRWGVQRTYPDYASMFAAEKLDAIMICGDNASKADIAEAAAAQGIHVYQDKAMAATLAQADRILKAVESSGITLMVAFHIAFSPSHSQVKSLLQTGAIGRVYLARGSIGHAGPKEFGCSPYFCEWLFDKQRNGGGTFIDEACYPLNAFLDYLGPVAEVSAFTAQIGHRDYLPPDVEDNAVAILRFASGALGILDSRWGQIGPSPVSSSYHGLSGTISIKERAVELYSALDPTVPAGWEPIEVQGAFVAHEPVKTKGWRGPTWTYGSSWESGDEARTFIDAVLGRKPLPDATTPRLARDVQEVIEAAYLSANLGRAVKLPLPRV